MCSGPVGKNQSYWGLIQVQVSADMTEDDLKAFKSKLNDFLRGKLVQADLPNNVNASLANGTIKTDNEDFTSIMLVKRK
jgi:hypothetical protein